LRSEGDGAFLYNAMMINVKDDRGTEFTVIGEWDGQRFYIDGLKRSNFDISYLLDLFPAKSDELSDLACKACAEKEMYHAILMRDIMKEDPDY